MRMRGGAVAGLLAGLLFLVSAAGPGIRAPGALPANLHPSILQQAKASPEGKVRVIVTGSTGATGLAEKAEALGARVTARWSLIEGFAAEVPSARVVDLARLPGVSAVLPDSPVTSVNVDEEASTAGTNGITASRTTAPALPYVMAVKADRMWEEGYTGSGITVAVVDTGIYGDGSRATDFGNRILASAVANPEASTPTDAYGHGTHVSGIIGGDGRNSGGAYKGIAPGVSLVNVKFGDDQGNASERDLITALQWVYEHKEAYRIRVVNLSATVTTQTSYLLSPTAAAVEQLWLNGVVVVVAAGNRGNEACSVCYPPANDPFVISVGAVDDNSTATPHDDFMKAWSSRGTTQDGFKKPDLMAPGARMISYMPAGSLREAAPRNIVRTHYFRMGGTSMSAPVVSGVVALLLQARPDLTPDQVKWLLQTTARRYRDQPPGTPGIVDAHEAYAYNRRVDAANHGLAPSQLLDPGSDTVDPDNVLWGNVLWGNVLWGHRLDD